MEIGIAVPQLWIAVGLVEQLRGQIVVHEEDIEEEAQEEKEEESISLGGSDPDSDRIRFSWRTSDFRQPNLAPLLLPRAVAGDSSAAATPRFGEHKWRSTAGTWDASQPEHPRPV